MKNLLIVKEILNSNGIPITTLRLLCLRSIIQFKTPFTVEQLISELRWETKINTSVARRTLSLYSKVGLISKVESETKPPIILHGRKKRQRDVNYQWIGQVNPFVDRDDDALPMESLNPDPNPTCL